MSISVRPCGCSATAFATAVAIGRDHIVRGLRRVFQRRSPLVIIRFVDGLLQRNPRTLKAPRYAPRSRPGGRRLAAAPPGPAHMRLQTESASRIRHRLPHHQRRLARIRAAAFATSNAMTTHGSQLPTCAKRVRLDGESGCPASRSLRCGIPLQKVRNPSHQKRQRTARTPAASPSHSACCTTNAATTAE